MNAITEAVRAIKNEIPIEILRLVFGVSGLRTLDDSILNSVIRGRVLPDCDMVGGRQFAVSLDKTEIVFKDERRFSFHIPKIITGGLSIVSADSIVANDGMNSNPFRGFRNRDHSNTITGAFNMLRNQGRVYGQAVSTRVELVGENTIVCHDPILHIPGLVFHGQVGNDHKAMSNITNREMPAFSELCVRCAKATIWTRAVILVDEAAIKNGHDMGMLSDIIKSDYANAINDYKEYRDNDWKKITWTMDEIAYNELISLSF